MSVWTQEIIDRMTALWADGKSAAAVAEALGAGLTRSAVLGKLHRIHTAPRPKPIRVVNPREKKPKARSTFNRFSVAARATSKPAAPTPPQKSLAKPSASAVHLVIPACERVTLLELRSNLCRFPLGDPRHESFRYCGADRPDDDAPDAPYCAFHQMVAYTAARPRPRPDRQAERQRVSRFAMLDRA